MKAIIKSSQVNRLAHHFHNLHQKIVLVGGCFDIVHLGHLIFLEKAKKTGDILFVILESDNTIRRLKGLNRPINSQLNRANFLTHIKSVDFIILLPDMKKDQDYKELINQIKPDIIAVTKNDSRLKLKKDEAKMVGAKLLVVTDNVPQQSTSLIIKKCYNTNPTKYE